jgi:hypothetical protein
MMKKLCLLILSIIVFNEGFTNLPGPGYPLSITATKNHQKKFYTIGEAVKVHFDSGNGETVAKGYIIRITKDTIEIGSFNKAKTSYFFNINALKSITHLNRKTRKGVIITTSVIAALVGILALASRGNLFESAYGLAFTTIIAAATIWWFTFFISLSYLFEVLRKRSLKKGWKFSVEEVRPQKKIRRFFE